MQPIDTPRLLIRNFKPSDGAGLLEMVQQYQRSGMAQYDNPWTTDPAEIERIVQWFSEGENILAVEHRNTCRLIGLISADPQEGEEAICNFGYLFNSDFHGQGYASEAASHVLHYLFIVREMKKVVAGTAAVNLPSQGLLNRLGFHQTGRVTASFHNDAKGKPITFPGLTYELSITDWSAQHMSTEPH